MTSQAELLEQFGSPETNRVVERLYKFAFIPPGVLASLADQALSEEWGSNNFVLTKYLAVHVPWSIEQGRYGQNEGQLYVTAGSLQTRYGTPLYLVFRDSPSEQSPWTLSFAGSHVSAPELPTAPQLPTPPEIPPGAEIVMMHDHILGENTDRVPFLRDTPPVAQMCAVAGAIQWSINRGLRLNYWYFGRMNYLVPLYLQSRENIALAPDLVAPIQVNEDNLLVRTVLSPVMPYANARVSVGRHDQLPSWLLDAWTRDAETQTEAQMEDPEARLSEASDLAGGD